MYIYIDIHEKNKYPCLQGDVKKSNAGLSIKKTTDTRNVDGDHVNKHVSKISTPTNG